MAHRSVHTLTHSDMQAHHTHTLYWPHPGEAILPELIHYVTRLSWELLDGHTDSGKHEEYRKLKTKGQFMKLWNITSKVCWAIKLKKYRQNKIQDIHSSDSLDTAHSKLPRHNCGGDNLESVFKVYVWVILVVVGSLMCTEAGISSLYCSCYRNW